MAVHPVGPRKATLISGYSLENMEASMAPGYLVLFCFVVISIIVATPERMNRCTALPKLKGSLGGGDEVESEKTQDRIVWQGQKSMNYISTVKGTVTTGPTHPSVVPCCPDARLSVIILYYK